MQTKTIKWPDDEYEAASKAADKENRTFSNFVKNAVKEYLATHYNTNMQPTSTPRSSQ